jgi:hypothetical protein
MSTPKKSKFPHHPEPNNYIAGLQMLFVLILLITSSHLYSQRPITYYEVGEHIPCWAKPVGSPTPTYINNAKRIVDRDEMFIIKDSISSATFVLIELLSFKGYVTSTGKNLVNEYDSMQAEMVGRGLSLKPYKRSDLEAAFNSVNPPAGFNSIINPRYHQNFNAFFNEFSDNLIWEENAGDPTLDSVYFSHEILPFRNQFYILKSDFHTCIAHYAVHEFTFGVVVLPDKLRFGNKSSDPSKNRYVNFTADVNIGINIGWKITPNAYKKDAPSITFVFGANYSSIPVDSNSTKKNATQTPYVTQATNVSAVSPAFGFVVDIPKTGNTGDFQLGVFVGGDILLGSVNRNWIYYQQPWLGFGIGYSIFTKDTAGKNAKTTNAKNQ